MDIDFCNASNKLKVYKGPEIILVKKIKKVKKVDAKLQDIIDLQGGSIEGIIIVDEIEKDSKEDNNIMNSLFIIDEIIDKLDIKKEKYKIPFPEYIFDFLKKKKKGSLGYINFLRDYKPYCKIQKLTN